MTKVYSSAVKDGLRSCVGPEIMKRKIKQCSAVLRPLDVPSTLWKYGRVLSHSAVLCKTQKEHVLIEYTSTNLVHINKIGGFKEKESEIGPCFEYRGFIFHYISPLQTPKKLITIQDFALKMAEYMQSKPYDVFTHNCHQARYLTMKYFGMRSHDPYNIKYNILFQGLADYFTNYNNNKIKNIIDYAKLTAGLTIDNSPLSDQDNLQNNFADEEQSRIITNQIYHQNNTKLAKFASSDCLMNGNIQHTRCSSTQNISKLNNGSEIASNDFFAHNIHNEKESLQNNSMTSLFTYPKHSESSSYLLNARRNTNSEDDVYSFQSKSNQRKKVLRRCQSYTHLSKIKNDSNHSHKSKQQQEQQMQPKQQEQSNEKEQKQQQDHSSFSDSTASGTSSESNSKYNATNTQSKKNKLFGKPKNKDKSKNNNYKKFGLLKIKKQRKSPTKCKDPENNRNKETLK